MKRHTRMAALLALAASAAWAGGLEVQSKTPTQKPGGGAGQTARRQFPATLLEPETLTAKAPEEFAVRFVTTKGAFVVKVTRAWAPRGADRFYNLVRNRFYDGASFFRVVPGFVVQFGLSAHPEVSKAWQNAKIEDDPVVQSNKRGFVTYAMGGKNTRTTQLFINLVDNVRLDAMDFAPFGEVVQGMDVVQLLYGGYGDGPPRGNGPQQGLIQERGGKYLQQDFPQLDNIRTARVVAVPRSTPAAKQVPAGSR